MKKQRMLPPVNRLSWDDYFLEVTKVVASRSSCLRRHVGAVLVKDKRILATGYNGAPSRIRHCFERGCLREKQGIPSGERQEICFGLHAEQNAIIQAALHGVSIKGATLYCTHQPCITCSKMLINSEVEKIIFLGSYPDLLSAELLQEAGINLEQRGSD